MSIIGVELKLFLFFLKLSASTIGGGYVMVPIMRRACIDRGWVDSVRFDTIFTLAQSLPGPIALNTAFLIGRECASLRGALISILGILIPPFFSIVLIASLIHSFGIDPALESFFRGLYAVIPGVVFAFTHGTVRRSREPIPILAIQIAGAILIIYFSSSLLFIIPLLLLLFFCVKR